MVCSRAMYVWLDHVCPSQIKGDQIMGDSNVALALGWEERSSIALMPKSGTDCYALGIPNQTPRNAATPIERL